jgi:hypothetical protein
MHTRNRGLFLIYPQVSSTTLLIFACTPLENGTSWLMADYRVQCVARARVCAVCVSIRACLCRA